MTLERGDEEDEGRGEEPENRDALQDVEEWEHDDGGLLVHRHRRAVRDREDEGERVRREHPAHGEEGEERELDREPRCRRKCEREAGPGCHEHDSDPPDPVAGSRHRSGSTGAGLFTGSPHGLCTLWFHAADINRRRIAFCAWSRFSAWSKTTDCGLSMTSSVISRPRWAGRQCITRASSLACFIRAEFT